MKHSSPLPWRHTMKNRREYRTVERRHEHRVAAVVSTDSTAPHGGFTAQVLRYGPPADDYNTTWEPGGGNDALDQRLPVLAWAHSWTEPIGRATRWWEEGDGLFMEFAFDDPTDVPRARQARSQLMSGTLTDVSIGFTREADEKNEDGSTNITKWAIDEVSIVLRGAVSGASVLAGSVRGVASRSVMPVDVAGRLAARLVAGDIDAAEFFAGIKDAATEGDRTAPTTPPAPGAPAATDDALLVLDEMLRGDAPDEQRWRRTVSRLEARFADLFANDLRGMLNDALNDRFQPGPDRWLWIADFTDGEVVFELEGFDDSGTFMLAYTRDGDAIVLDAGDPVEVQRHTTYVPDPDETGRGAADGEQRDAAPSDADIDAALALARVKR